MRRVISGEPNFVRPRLEFLRDLPLRREVVDLGTKIPALRLTMAYCALDGRARHDDRGSDVASEVAAPRLQPVALDRVW